MLGALCARPKQPWILTSLLSFFHHRPFLPERPQKFNHHLLEVQPRPGRHHTSACRLLLGSRGGGGAASIWHAILPSAGSGPGDRRELLRHHREQKGEGSWNVSWDARPARWLHRPDSAWFLFGVCSCLDPPAPAPIAADEKFLTELCSSISSSTNTSIDIDSISVDNNSNNNSVDYRVTGVPADGRCLFRAIAHLACLRNGKEAPDEDLQTKLADELRAQVVDELLKRRKETEWFIDGDFDVYVNQMREPYVWGGEPELLMASHVLRTSIAVFMRDRSSSSGDLVNIANYGEEEYKKEDEIPIKVLFHGYGHYDILEEAI